MKDILVLLVFAFVMSQGVFFSVRKKNLFIIYDLSSSVEFAG